MNRKDITAKQIQATIAMFFIGSSIIAGGENSAKQDTWLTILIAVALTIPMLWVHTKILQLYPGQSYYGNIIRALGKPLGRFVCALYVFYALHLGGQVIRTFSEFIHVVNMTETPVLAIAAFILATLAYILQKHLYVLTRISKFLLPIMYFTVAMMVVLSFPNMHISNIKPMFQSTPADLLKGVSIAFALPYGQVVACAPMMEQMNRKEKIFPTFLKGTLLAFGILFAANLRNLLVLGYSVSVYAFPSYEAISVIQIGTFFTRVEVLIGINLMLSGFIKAGVLIYSSCNGLAKIFEFRDCVPLVVPVTLLMLTMAMVVHRDTVEMFLWLGNYLDLFMLPFQVILPIIILLVGILRKKFQKPQKKQNVAVKNESKSVSANAQQN
ncbi:MAG: Spore germination protein YndE [Oscillospiraceae bacterium]|jgi:spore germination protein KB